MRQEVSSAFVRSSNCSCLSPICGLQPRWPWCRVQCGVGTSSTVTFDRYAALCVLHSGLALLPCSGATLSDGKVILYTHRTSRQAGSMQLYCTVKTTEPRSGNILAVPLSMYLILSWALWLLLRSGGCTLPFVTSARILATGGK